MLFSDNPVYNKFLKDLQTGLQKNKVWITRKNFPNLMAILFQLYMFDFIEYYVEQNGYFTVFLYKSSVEGRKFVKNTSITTKENRQYFFELLYNGTGKFFVTDVAEEENFPERVPPVLFGYIFLEDTMYVFWGYLTIFTLKWPEKK